MINLQDLINGIDWIADRFAGKTCVDLDIDRQSITPFGTPQQVSQQALNIIKKSRQNRPSGGKRISGSRSLLRRLLPPVA